MLRDTALAVEREDMSVAFELMSLAAIGRPSGEFIASKVSHYRTILGSKSADLAIAFYDRLHRGDIAIIPSGFRCYAKQKLLDYYGIRQASLPFDYGFFPPASIVNILAQKRVDFDYSRKDTYSPCLKTELFECPDDRTVIKFETSTFESIDDLVHQSTSANLNSCLDSTGAYYILDRRNGYVLAHYIWHPSASRNYSGGISDLECSMAGARLIINRRVDRLFAICEKASKIIFVVDLPVQVSAMIVDNAEYPLHDLVPLQLAIHNLFGAKADVLPIADNLCRREFFDNLLDRV